MQRKAAEDPIARRSWEKAGSAQKQRQRRERARAVMSKKLVAGENRLENGGLECASAAPHVFSAQLKLGFGSVYSGRSSACQRQNRGNKEIWMLVGLIQAGVI